jgi:hypothetical protein
MANRETHVHLRHREDINVDMIISPLKVGEVEFRANWREKNLFTSDKNKVK